MFGRRQAPLTEVANERAAPFFEFSPEICILVLMVSTCKMPAPCPALKVSWGA